MFFNHRKRTAAIAAAVIGAVCLSYGVDKPSQSGVGGDAAYKTSPAEAPGVLYSFEAYFLAAWAEEGAVNSKDDLLVDDITEANAKSKWFAYDISEDGHSCKAIAKVDIGNFKRNDYIMTKWSGNENNGFVHSSNNEDGIRYLMPNFFRK